MAITRKKLFLKNVEPPEWWISSLGYYIWFQDRKGNYYKLEGSTPGWVTLIGECNTVELTFGEYSQCTTSKSGHYVVHRAVRVCVEKGGKKNG